ncbi:MAG: divalent-cation tolerance protein CutA [Thermococci archaeon]|nr:divalent-cation tolerance protein CutA [Thermococci archaeon]
MEVVLVYTTFPDMKSAEEAVRKMLELRLIACANLREHTSMYIWEGEVRKEGEVGVIMKTDVSKWKDVKTFLRENHPYEIPLILRLDADRINGEYSEWMAEVLGLE